MTSVRTTVLRLAAAAALVAVGCVGLTGTAAAHNVLISSSPADGATLTHVPTTVVFTFDQPVQNFDPVVSLVGPDGRQDAVGPPAISGNVVTEQVSTGPAGAYTAGYRVVSADGHPVTGEVHFVLAVGATKPTQRSGTAPATVAGPTPASRPPGTAGPTPPGQATTAPSAGRPAGATAPTRSAGLSAWLWIGLGVAAVIVAAAAVLLLRRPRSAPSTHA